MKRILSIAALIVASTFITANASAQDHRVRATVPFEFSVNGSVVPAGTYTIVAPIGQDVVDISSWQAKVHLLVSADSNWGDRRNDNVLAFHKIGDQYFLSEIRCHDSAMSVYFPPSKAEQRAQTQTVRAGIPMSTDVMVALN